MCILQTSSLSIGFGYPGKTIVTDFSIEVARGEAFCLLGPSGAGKTMVARAVSGTLPRGIFIRNGKILVEGHDVSKDPALVEKIGLVFQEPSVSLDLISRPLKLITEILELAKGLPRKLAVEKARIILEREGLPPESIKEKYIYQMSGGMKQRLIIAAVMAKQPEILVLDEPTSSLDPLLTAYFIRRIRTLGRERGVLWVTHDHRIASSIAEKVAVMAKGAVIEMGGRDEIMNEPLHPFTRWFLGFGDVFEPRETRDRVGCAFASICPKAFDKCREFPPLQRLEGTRSIRCWIPGELVEK